MRCSLLLLSLLPSFAAAYPIPPRTLWSLSQEAELIVLARVDRVDSGVAVLEVLETWKGTAQRTVAVTFEPNMICPAPARYVPGRRVVAFLAKYERSWTTVALSYGTRYPADSREERDHADAVKRALAEKGDAPSVEWALATARSRATRWDGLYALQSSADGRLKYYDRRARNPEPLSADVIAELQRIMIDTPSFDRTLPQLLTLLKDVRDPAVTAAATDAIESLLAGSSAPYWIDEAFDLLEARLGAAPATAGATTPADPLEAEMKRVTEPWKMKPAEREESAQSRWHAMKLKYQLAPNRRSDFSPTRWTGTGGETPL